MRVRVMVGTVVHGGRYEEGKDGKQGTHIPGTVYGPGAPLDLPDDEAKQLIEDGTVAPIADDLPAPKGKPNDGKPEGGKGEKGGAPD